MHHTLRPKPSFLSVPFEIRAEVYSHLLNGHLRLSPPCPPSRAARKVSKSPVSLLRTCRQIHAEAMPFLYRRIHFGWLANIPKALSNPARRALYASNIVEATCQYDVAIGRTSLECLTTLNRLQRLVLLGEVSAPHAEARHVTAVFDSVRLYRDDLGALDPRITFPVFFEISVVDLWNQDGRRKSQSGYIVNDNVEPAIVSNVPARAILVVANMHRLTPISSTRRKRS
jgi:hypothetical protein